MAKSSTGSSLGKATPGLAASIRDSHVQVSLHLNLRSQPRATATWPLAPAAQQATAAPTPDTSSTARARSSSGTAASVAPGNAVTGDAADAQVAAPHILQIKLSGLHGLQQEIPAAPGHTEQVDQQCWQDVYSVAVTQQQVITVDEQLTRSWASAAGQLHLHIAVLPQADSLSNTAKKPATAPPAKNAALVPAVIPMAAGTLQLNCAGLLVGDPSADYSWTNSTDSSACTSTASAAEEAAPSSTNAGCTVHAIDGKDIAACTKAGTQPWKTHQQSPSGNLCSWLSSVDISLQLSKAPVLGDPSDPKTAAVTASSAGSAAAGGPNSGPPAASSAGSKPPAGKSAVVDPAAISPATADAVLQPCSLLTPEQAAVYNPVVVNVYKAAWLPDAPATQQQLDEQCQPVKLKASWPPLVSGAEQVASVLGRWSRVNPTLNPSCSKASTTVSGSSPTSSRPFLEPAVRSVLFSTPLVFLGCDLGSPQQLIQHCRSKQLELQVHDRTATESEILLEPATAPSSGTLAAAADPAPSNNPKTKSAAAAAQTAAATAVAAPAAEHTQSANMSYNTTDDGEVYGAASVSLLDLVRGLTSFRFAAPLRPATTVRGAASLDLRRRPGNYMQANSELKGWVRAAAPLHAMKGLKNGTASASSSTTTSPRTAVVVAAARHGSRLSSTGAAAAASAPGLSPAMAAASAVSSTAGGKGLNARSSVAQVKLLQQQQQVEQQQVAAQQVAAELQQQLEQHKDQPPQPTAYVALPADVRYPGAFSRAVFLFDYRDSDLFHTLEDTIRQHNAIVLGLAPPPPPTAKEVEAAKAAAAAVEAATAAASIGSRLGTAASRAAAAAKAAAAARLAAKAAASAAGSAAAAASKQVGQLGGTPRPILRASITGNLNGSLISVPSITGTAAGAAALTKGSHSVDAQQQQRRLHHAHFACELDLDYSDSAGSDSNCSSESEADERELRLQAALSRYDHVTLDTKILQNLSSQQLDAQQASDPQLDVLTGFHLVDGTFRLVIVEGPAAGTGMTATVAAISQWAHEEQQQGYQQQEGWLPRRIVHNPHIKYSERLYSSLGIDLWMVKLKADLGVLGAQPATYASGRVRPDCIAGMECLLALTAGYQPVQNSNISSNKRCSNLQPGHPIGALPATSRQITGSGQRLQTGSGAQMSASRTAAVAKKSGQHTSSIHRAGGSAAANCAPGTAAAAAAAYAGAGCLGRLLDEMQLYPTAAQMHLIDKKFGGELTKADVLGVEADEPDSDSDSEIDLLNPRKQHQQQRVQDLSATHAAASAVKAASKKVMALLCQEFDSYAVSGRPEMVSASGAVASSAGSSKSHHSSKRSRGSKSRSRKSHLSSLSGSKPKRKNRRFFRRPLEIDNEVYLHLRQEAQRKREQRNLAAEHEQYLHGLELSMQRVRDTWATWNPQRAATRQLENAISTGTITLQDTIKARQELDDTPTAPIPGTISGSESLQRGWYPHDKPFLWPAPRDPELYRSHPLKPSEYRLQELEEPWQEGTLQGGLAFGGIPSDHNRDADFNTLIKGPPGGLFTQDPAYWQSVHLGGDCWEEQLAAAKAEAKAEWAAKVVVKDINIHVVPGTGDKAQAQADRLNNLLKGQPVKKGFKVTHAPPAPTSMYIQTPWEGPAAPGCSGTKSSKVDGMALGPNHEVRMITSAERAKWIGGKDFDARGRLMRSAVAKPGFSDAVTASLHDKLS